MITVTKFTQIKNIKFLNGSIMFVHLSNDRTFLVPLDKFPEIKQLSQKQKKEFEIIDGNHLSFLAINDTYSLTELTGIE